MEIDFEDIIGKEKNKPCLIVGPGPTMNDFPYNKFNGTIISIGDSALRGKSFFSPNYWISSNGAFIIPEIDLHLKIINSFKNTTFLFAETEMYNSLWKKSQKYLEKNLRVKWLMFDERHFNGQICKPKRNCCDLIKKRSEDVFTIQELASKIYNFDERATQGATVFEYALALALILKCNPIYIQGIDLPFGKKKIQFNKDMHEIDFYLGRSGHGYFVDTDYKSEIIEMYKMTNKIIFERSNLLSKKSLTFFISRMYNFFIKIYKLCFENRFSLEKDWDVISKNINIYLKICLINNIKVFYLNKSSNLKLMKNIRFINSSDIN